MPVIVISNCYYLLFRIANYVISNCYCCLCLGYRYMEVNGRICIVTCLCRCIVRCIYRCIDSVSAAEINPVPWDVFRPTMRVVMCPALPYPLTFTSKNPIPRTKTKNIFDLFLFPLFPLLYNTEYVSFRYSPLAPLAPCAL